MTVEFEFEAKVTFPDIDKLATVEALENALKVLLENETEGKAEVKVHYLKEVNE